MKTTLHGGVRSLQEDDFNHDVAKYGDNGLAETDAELPAYLAEYRRRAGFDCVVSALEDKIARLHHALPRAGLPALQARPVDLREDALRPIHLTQRSRAQRGVSKGGNRNISATSRCFST